MAYLILKEIKKISKVYQSHKETVTMMSSLNKEGQRFSGPYAVHISNCLKMGSAFSNLLRKSK
jgi:hypothetical protein